jgi:tetratricopeptide (TPR) repeat protein
LIFEETQGDGFTVYIKKEKIDEFLQLAKRLANLDKESPYSHFILLSILFSLGKSDESLKSAEKVIQIEPSYYKETPWIIMGDIYLAKGKLDMAYCAYKKAASIEPLKVVKLLDVMNAYSDLRKKEFIKKEIDNVILSIKEEERLNPDNIFFKKQLAFIYANMGQYREAIFYLKEILLIEPNDPWANELFETLKNFS